MKKIKQLLTDSRVRNTLSHVSEWIISAFIGVIISNLVGKPLIAIAFFAIFSFFSIIYLIVVGKIESQWDITKIMLIEQEAGNHTQVIRIGYPLSRPLHLSGRINLRFRIGKLVNASCAELLRRNITSIEIEGKSIRIREIYSRTLIDDLGWTAYELNKVDIATDNIRKGIKIAEQDKMYALALKGYRHLIGIYDKMGEPNKSDFATQRGEKIISSRTFKNQVDDSFYIHTKAEFDYARAKSIAEEDPKQALAMAKEVQQIFSGESAKDNDRYAKTFDLIGGIYANYNNPQNLKIARETYKEGIDKCKEYGRSERLIRITIHYISLLCRMLEHQKIIYDKESWANLDEEEKQDYEYALSCVARTENSSMEWKLKKVHRNYRRLRKQYNRDHRL